MPTPAIIALGSNLGDRRRMLNQAVVLLRALPGTEVIAVSKVIETKPWGLTDQPLFLNSALRIHTTSAADELLTQLQAIEKRLGRRRLVRWGPRPIDLDIIFFGDEIWQTPHLKIPHPLLQERLFVLEPLLEIAPDWVHPVFRKKVRELYTELRIREAGRSASFIS